MTRRIKIDFVSTRTRLRIARCKLDLSNAQLAGRTITQIAQPAVRQLNVLGEPVTADDPHAGAAEIWEIPGPAGTEVPPPQPPLTPRSMGGPAERMRRSTRCRRPPRAPGVRDPDRPHEASPGARRIGCAPPPD